MVSLTPRFGVCNLCTRRGTEGAGFLLGRQVREDALRKARHCARSLILFGSAELLLTVEDVERVRQLAGLPRARARADV